MHLRRLINGDLPQLLQLYHQLHAEDTAADKTSLDSAWQQLVESDWQFILGGFLSETLIASCCLAINANLTRGARPYGIIENMVTHKDFRGRGFGKKLMQFAVNTAWQHKCHKVMLLTGRQSETVLNFYKNCGFKSDEKTAFICRASN